MFKVHSPEVILLQETGLGVAEYAARTCYDSFNASENDSLKQLNDYLNEDERAPSVEKDLIQGINDVESSNLLDNLAWVHFHHSIIEHVNLSYLIKGTSRGVLQEHARHRIQAISVRSTRYTMSSVLNAYIASYTQWHDVSVATARGNFKEHIKSLDVLCITENDYIELECNAMYDKLTLQVQGNFSDMLSPEGLHILDNMSSFDGLFDELQKAKKKRNVGDSFKHIVTDNWKVDMVVTFNLRSLKNYFDLRDSGAAYFQIRTLAQEMKKVTPMKYLKLIDKKAKDA